ncbi:MAG: XdhC family protein [Gemmatirosa sp.]|nr:XdhC family protein [Gemmatirosa sp.]
MTPLRTITDALHQCAEIGQATVLATVVRVVGSSYGGVGTRMVVRVDGTTVGIVSGGCLESDLAGHARRVHESGRAEVVSYDTRADDDAVWGLGLGCNGLIDVLLEPLPPNHAAAVASLLATALDADAPRVLATVIHVDASASGAPAVGAHALLDGDDARTTGAWGDGRALAAAHANAGDAFGAGRGGLVRETDGVRLAFEVVAPTVELLICGSGPDAVPVARLATQLGWDVTVVDHRPVEHAHPERFPGARVAECADAARLGDYVPLRARTAAVVMSHHFARDADYLHALLAARPQPSSTAGVAYVGVLGPRSRTERMLAELASRGAPAGSPAVDARLHGPIGLDVGGDGPEAIALSIIAEVSAVVHGREGGFLRDRRAPLHAPPHAPAARAMTHDAR